MTNTNPKPCPVCDCPPPPLFGETGEPSPCEVCCAAHIDYWRNRAIELQAEQQSPGQPTVDSLISKLKYGVCDHGVAFDARAVMGLSPKDVRAKFPRLVGVCPKGCGFEGIAYASREHYIMGGW